MKHWKQGFIGLLVVITLVFATCKDDPPPQDCSCDPKDHLGDYDSTACGCGDKNCDCTPKVIAKIGTVPVYKKSGVTDTGTAIYRMNGAYPAIDAIGFNNYVKEVVIVSGNSTDKTISGGKWVITIGEEAQNLFDIMNDSCSAPN